MGFRSRLRAHSHSGRSPSPQPQKQYGALPPNSIQPVILNIAQPAPTVSILSQQSDSKPLFQIDYSPVLTITHVHTAQPIGTIGFNTNHKLTLNQPSTNASVTYQDTLYPPAWFRSLNGNAIYWDIPAFNGYQATLHGEIVDGIDHPDDENDIAVAVILDSKWKKGRIEFRKQMSKEEMDLLLLSAIAEIEDLKGKIQNGEAGAMGAGGTALAARPAQSSSANQVAGYLKVAKGGANFASAVSGGGGGGA